MKKKLKVLVLFDGTSPTTVDQDFTRELKTKDWKTEADVMTALGALGYTAEHLAIYDDVDLVRQKLETFAPDILFNLVEQFRNNPGFDQNIVSFFEMQGLPFTGCGSTGLTLCKHKGISKKILHYHGIHVPNFVVIPRGQRIARLKQENKLYFIEANPNPILADDEDFALAAGKAGLSYAKLIDRIVRQGMTTERE